jgi:hypothetical protein
MRKYLPFALSLMLLGSPELFAAPLVALPAAPPMNAAPAKPVMPQQAPNDNGPISQRYDNGRHHLRLYFDPNKQSGSVYVRSDTDNTDLDVDAYGKAAPDKVKGWGDVETGVFAGDVESRGEVVHGVSAKPPSGGSH